MTSAQTVAFFLPLRKMENFYVEECLVLFVCTSQPSLINRKLLKFSFHDMELLSLSPIFLLVPDWASCFPLIKLVWFHFV